MSSVLRLRHEGQYHPEGLSNTLLNISIFLPWSLVSEEPKVTLNQGLYTLTTLTAKPERFRMCCIWARRRVHFNEGARGRPDGLWSHQLTNHSGPALRHRTSKETTAKTYNQTLICLIIKSQTVPDSIACLFKVILGYYPFITNHHWSQSVYLIPAFDLWKMSAVAIYSGFPHATRDMMTTSIDCNWSASLSVKTVLEHTDRWIGCTVCVYLQYLGFNIYIDGHYTINCNNVTVYIYMWPYNMLWAVLSNLSHDSLLHYAPMY